MELTTEKHTLQQLTGLVLNFSWLLHKILKLDTKSIGFVLGFPQDNLDVPVYMELPSGMDLADHGKDSSKYLLKLKKSLYGLNNASLNWQNKLKDVLGG